MAKKNPGKPVKTVERVEPVIEQKKGFQLPGWSYYLIVFLFACMLYSNTIWNKYAIDDTIVLTDNKFTKKGLAGIKDHFTHDMFEGFFGERGARLVSGGRYRPLSMVSLTVEYEISRKMKGDKRGVIDDKNVILGDNDQYLNPVLNHSVNILLFGLTCLVLFYTLQQIIPKKYALQTPVGSISLGFIATLLYAAHPLHTEAVANVKGRDEVMCMLFSMLALLAAIKYVKTQRIVHLLWGMAIYFIALLSKENAITFFAIVPLTYFFFTKATAKDYGVTLVLYMVPVLLFLFLRSQFTHAGLTQDSPEILNNPFLTATMSQRYATAVLTFLYYFKLLVFPYPLTHDYYYNQIPYVDFGDIKFILSFLINAGLLVYALINLKKKSIASYAILFYFITFSIASNLLFTVGVLMNERFIYMSSLGFCILFAYSIIRSKEWIKIPTPVATGILLVVLCLYSYKTFSRNFDWYESFTLFRRDVLKSPNSAKIQTSVGGDLAKAADNDIAGMRASGKIKEIFSDLSDGSLNSDDLNRLLSQPDTTIRKLLLDSSIVHLQDAIRIYPTHSNAWLLLGNSIYKRNHKPEEVIPIYEKAGAYRVGGYYDANFNLGIVYNEIKDANPANNYQNLVKAKNNFIIAAGLKPEVPDSRFLLAQVYAKMNQPDSVTYWLQKAQEIKPAAASDYYAIGTNFGKVANNLPMAIQYLKKAVEMAPKVELYYEDLGAAYGFSGQYDMAIATSLKLIEINPKYPAAYQNLSVSYGMKGNKKMAEEYHAKYLELVPPPANTGNAHPVNDSVPSGIQVPQKQ